METENSTGSVGPLMRRFVDWVLDTRGSMYGDELERKRYYEGTTVAASLQWLVLPWLMAFAIWKGGRPVVSYVVAFALVLYLPILFSSIYVLRNRVRTPKSPTPGLLILQIIFGLSFPAIGVLAIGAYDSGIDSEFDGGLIAWTVGGGLAGGFIGLVGVKLYQRRQQRSSLGRTTDVTRY
jgi:hypothetical protein